MKKYKFFNVVFNNGGKPDEIYMTYDMIEQKFKIKQQSLKSSLQELIEVGFVYEFTECETENLDLYTAILNQDYKKIYGMTSET